MINTTTSYYNVRLLSWCTRETPCSQVDTPIWRYIIFIVNFVLSLTHTYTAIDTKLIVTIPDNPIVFALWHNAAVRNKYIGGTYNTHYNNEVYIIPLFYLTHQRQPLLKAIGSRYTYLIILLSSIILFDNGQSRIIILYGLFSMSLSAYDLLG